LAVDLYLPVSTGPPTWHEEANRTSYMSPWETMPVPGMGWIDRTPAWYFLCGLDVAALERSCRCRLGDSV
jgi:hypothetical protein